MQLRTESWQLGGELWKWSKAGVTFPAFAILEWMFPGELHQSDRPSAGLHLRSGIAFLAMLAVLTCAPSLSATASSSRPRLSLIALSPGNIRVHDGGQLAIGVLCHAASGACTGRVLISAAHASAQTAPLAAVNIHVLLGRSAPITLTLTRTARRALARQHRLRVRIIIGARNHAHRLGGFSARLTLVPGAPVGCWPQPVGSLSLWNSPTARLFTGGPGDHTYGCLYKLDRAFPLYGAGSNSGLQLADPLEFVDPLGNPVPFADPYVASVLDGGNPVKLVPPPFYDVASWDLRTGRRVHLDRLGTDVSIGELSLVVSRTDGAIAWISGYGGAAPDVATVGADDAGGRRQLDSGNGIDVSSLRLIGDIVSWTHDGQIRTATLLVRCVS